MVTCNAMASVTSLVPSSLLDLHLPYNHRDRAVAAETCGIKPVMRWSMRFYAKMKDLTSFWKAGTKT
ncbi:hypothetical protein BPA01_18120 [Brevibacillus parabrevis]|uniref:Uncharacterized protein n=1 Tax=Brevibacillus parabrevis TaxID=54914 RepID=A0A4Y3PCT6_BREPA|nr:hypothetical protein BPA01_18120 [Brevibacillus parabrevis]